VLERERGIGLLATSRFPVVNIMYYCIETHLCV
jgi:hypothetical protein